MSLYTIMNDLKSYINKVTGFDVKELPYLADAIKRLPLFIREGYGFTLCEFYNHRVVFVEPGSSGNVTPGNLQKHIPKIESALGCPVIMVFHELTYYLKEQLVKSRISFIVPGKQLFIPFLFMDLSDQQIIRVTRTDYFSPSTQCVLIYHLWKRSLEKLNFQEIAELFEYTPRTIGRCAQELEHAGVCRITGTRSKYLEFGMGKTELWEKALPFLKSPVSDSKWLFTEPDDPYYFKVAGVPALSGYSILSPGRVHVYALDAKAYRELTNRGYVSDSVFNEADIQLQIWSYDPGILTDNHIVDPFSLYLSLKDDPDERVQLELDGMLARILQ